MKPLLRRPRSDNTRIVILGNQKSGTSVIAHLLADFGDLSKTIDIPEIWGRNLTKLLRGETILSDLSRRYPHRFFAQLVKEPNLTFFYTDLKSIYTDAQFVFILRDPRDNIRSILNRLDLPGDLKRLDEATHPIPHSWRLIFDPALFNFGEMDHYIDILSMRWNHTVDVYLKNRDAFHLITYEAFSANKVRTISTLAADLGLPKVHDISAKIDIQYQPRGNREISWIDFFGQENLHRIEMKCEKQMLQLGYSV